MAKYESPIMKLPDEHMRLVGIIAAHWEYATALINRVVQEIMGLPEERVKLLTQEVGMEKKFNLISIQVHSVIKQAKEDPKSPIDAADLEKRLNSLLEQLRSSGRLRNTYVHAAWVFNDDTKQLERHSAQAGKKRLEVTSDPISEAELADAADEIYEAASAVIDFFVPMGLLQSSGGRSR